jgi:hypothetical protein
MVNTGSPEQIKLKVFISYSRKDDEFAQELVAGKPPTSRRILTSTTCRGRRVGDAARTPHRGSRRRPIRHLTGRRYLEAMLHGKSSAHAN